MLKGANHFAIANPADSTLGIANLDFASKGSEAEICSLMASTIGLFIDTYICDRLPKSQFLQLLQNNPLIALSKFK